MGTVEERLKAAEDLCVMFAWCASRNESPTDKAAHELWVRWTEVSGNSCSQAENPHLSESLITKLALKRDRTRRSVLAHFGLEGRTQDA